MNIGRIKEALIKYEGKVMKNGRHMPFHDPLYHEIITIGYGRNLSGRGLSETEAQYLLTNDINDAINDLRRNLPWFESLDEVRQEVLINMVYNIGINSLLGFKNTLDYISTGDYHSAAAGMLASKWAREVGNRALELSKAMETGSFD